MQETVILDDVRTDGGTQPREYLNELVLSEYAESMTDGAMFPPVVVFFDGRHYWLADGFHRFFAAKKCGAQEIEAEVRQGTRRDARLYAVGANAAHGLRRTNADKRRAALTLLQDEEWQRWSNREIARQCGVTHTFVAKLRRELLGESPSPASEVAAARPEPAGMAEPQPTAPAVSPSASYTGDEFFEAPSARQADDLFDQLAPSEPASTMDRLAFENPEPIAMPPLAEAHTPPVSRASVPQAGHGRSPDVTSASETKLTIDAMAATSQQAPDEWMAEMMVYWLLDLSAQYEGITPALVRQAADRLGQQYTQAYQEIAPSA